MPMRSHRLSDGAVQTPHSRITLPHGRSPQEVVREHVPRFRVLVMGRRNAGKTTILQKMTQSSDGQFVIHDADGNRVDPGSILQPSVERGKSRIDWEITYPSNPGFVFHDSRGMEAGSSNELQTLKDFMNRRLRMVALNEKLHVIWYCLPTDTSRPLCHEEMAFFEQGTGDVPVIAVFTKFEDRITKAFGQLRDNGMSMREARRHAPEKARQDFEVLFSERRRQMRYPPAACVYLQHMNRPETTCADLTLVTYRTIQTEVISRLFAMVQRNSVEVSMGIALVYAMSLANERHEHTHKLYEWSILLLSLFPNWKEFFNMEDHWEWHWKWDDDWAPTFKFQDREVVHVIIQAAVSWKNPSTTTKEQLLVFFIDVLVIAECLFWNGGSTPYNIDLVQNVIFQYDNSQASRDRFRAIAGALLEDMTTRVLGNEGHLYRDRLRALAVEYQKRLLDDHFELRC